jgi:hypothetical protein
MACALTQGYTLDCRDSAGGVKSVYFIEHGNVTGVTVASGVVSAIAKAGGGRFYKYTLHRATASFTEEFQDNIQNGTVFNRQTLNIILNKMQASLRNEISLLAANVLLAVVEDQNGKYWLAGYENGLMREGGSGGTGTALGDRNGYTLNFTGDERIMAYEVNSSVIAGLTTP